MAGLRCRRIWWEKLSRGLTFKDDTCRTKAHHDRSLEAVWTGEFCIKPIRTLLSRVTDDNRSALVRPELVGEKVPLLECTARRIGVIYELVEVVRRIRQDVYITSRGWGWWVTESRRMEG